LFTGRHCFGAGGDIFLGGMDNHFSLPVYPYDPSGVYPAERITRTTRHSTEVFVDRAMEFIGEHAAQARNHSAPTGEPFFSQLLFYFSARSPPCPPEWHAVSCRGDSAAGQFLRSTPL